jgi:signal transduction histidine kinase
MISVNFHVLHDEDAQADHELTGSERAGVGTFVCAHWNNIGVGTAGPNRGIIFRATALTDDAGNPNAATIAPSVRSTYFVGYCGSVATWAQELRLPDTHDDDLFNSYLALGSADAAVLQVTGISSNFTAGGYQVVIYSDTDRRAATGAGAGRQSLFTLTPGGGSPVTALTEDDPGAIENNTFSGIYIRSDNVEDGPDYSNCTVFEGLAAESFTLAIRSPDGVRGGISGFQIIAGDQPLVAGISSDKSSVFVGSQGVDSRDGFDPKSDLSSADIGAVSVARNGVPAFKGYSDPRNPSELDPDASIFETSGFNISARLKRVEQAIEQERSALDALAPFQASRQFDAFGYHSDYIPAVNGVPDEPLWTVTLSSGHHPTVGIVLVPAFDHRSSDLGGYAFPKRFRICTVDALGRRSEVYVDWTAQDFPDPGMRPVYFGFSPDEAPTRRLLLDVFDGHEESGFEFFALGRIHLIRQDEQQGIRWLIASSSFESAPYWSKFYLNSLRHTVGMPLSVKDGSGGTLTVPMPASQMEKPLVIRIELDRTENLGWINLFPGQGPGGIDVPGFGFPKKMRIFRIFRKNPNDKEERFPVEDLGQLENVGNNMVRVPGLNKKASAVEIECNDFPVYQGQAVFSLGEIEVIKSKRNLTKGRRVSIRGVELDEPFDLSALVDGRVGGRDILQLPEWLQQLAAGKPHEARLRVLESERLVLVERLQRIGKQALMGLGLLVFTGILVFVWIMLRSKKMAQVRLRRQISSDLHDDVGSSLGSISLTAEQLKCADVNEEVRADLFELSLMAREACVSLREVFWVTDERSIHLPALIQKLVERAERVLHGKTLTVERTPNCPDIPVSLSCKRHLIMLFKEMIHNCARHSGATDVDLCISAVDRHLKVSVRDNGCGFDPEAVFRGWGLDSLKERASEIGGTLQIDSEPGTGTKIDFHVPLSILSKDVGGAYTTSN